MKPSAKEAFFLSPPSPSSPPYVRLNLQLVGIDSILGFTLHCLEFTGLKKEKKVGQSYEKSTPVFTFFVYVFKGFYIFLFINHSAAQKNIASQGRTEKLKRGGETEGGAGIDRKKLFL